MINVSDLRTAVRFTPDPTIRNLQEAKVLGRKTAFLCHSHHDEELARGLAKLLWDKGWKVYIDWLDTSMPAKPDRTTATKIQQKIVQSDFFLFLATANSMASRWCPWELGYADGRKVIDSIVIVPTKEGQSTHGSEYLSLYRHIDHNELGRLAVKAAGAASWHQGVLLETI